MLIDRLSYDPKVIEAIKSHAAENHLPLEMVQKKAIRYAKEIIPSFNAYFYFRTGYWIAKRIARLLYRVRVGLVPDDAYRRIDPDSTVVFVMNHRSNMDYIIVAFLAAERTTLSYAVGEWAKIWPLHMLFRFMGAFFVRRNSKNPLYRRVLERYIHMATQEGVCQAVFLEGGLSRDGRMGKPKLGLVDYMLRHFDPQRDRDLVFIPVGINYDRTIEDRSLLRSLDPDAPAKGVLFILRKTIGFIGRNIVQMMFSQWRRFGYACVNFGNPISIQSYCRTKNVVFSNLEREERFPLIEVLCESLLKEISHVIPVVPISVLAVIFLDAGDEALTVQMIEYRSQQLIQQLSDQGAPVFDISQSARSQMISDTLEMMLIRRMIHVDKGRLIIVADQIPLLKYYANAINHWINL